MDSSAFAAVDADGSGVAVADVVWSKNHPYRDINISCLCHNAFVFCLK
jgi:hypothetical protein